MVLYALDERGNAKPADMAEWDKWYDEVPSRELTVGTHQVVRRKSDGYIYAVPATRNRYPDLEILSTIETRYLRPREQQALGVVGLTWRIYSNDTGSGCGEEVAYTAKRKSAEEAHKARIDMLICYHKSKR